MRILQRERVPRRAWDGTQLCSLPDRGQRVPGSASHRCFSLFHPLLLPRSDPATSGQAAEDEVGADVAADCREGAHGHVVHLLS